MASFDITLQTRASLHPHGEPDDFISEYSGIIRYTRDRDGKVFRVGRVQAYRIHAGLACNHGESLFDVCDAHSQEMHELYATLFDPDDDNFKESIQDRFEAIDTDVLVLDHVILHPRWRGLKLGLVAVRKMIDLLGGGCGLTVSDIRPVIPEAHSRLKVPQTWLPEHPTREDHRLACHKLRRHFRRMGFQRIRGSRLFAMSMARVVPTAAELIRPSTEAR